MVLVEKLNFFHFLICGKIGRKKAFGVIVERKKPLQTLKRRAKKKNRTIAFFQRVSPWF